MSDLRKSTLTYGLIFLVVILFKAGLTLFPADHPQTRQSLIQWNEILLWGAVGFGLLRLAPRAGFPDIWDEGVSQVRRFLVPLILGVGLAGLTIGESLVHGWPDFHVPFPQSVFVYGSVSVLYEIKYHLLPIVLIVWIAFDLKLEKRWQSIFFWTVAILLSLYEPFNQIRLMVKMKMVSGTLWTAASFIKIFLANLVPLYLFKRSGFFSLVGFRFGSYLVWHIIWPVIYFAS